MSRGAGNPDGDTHADPGSQAPGPMAPRSSPGPGRSASPAAAGPAAPRPAGWGLWGALSRWMVATGWVVWTIVAICLASAVAGYIYWYGDDILAAPYYLWPFVPDSPLSATFFALALLAYHRGLRLELLGLLAVTGVIKYGLWTDWVWFTNALSGGAYSFEAIHLSASHFAMVLLGLALLPTLRPKARHVLFVAAWYAANDLTDYGLGSHPRVPNPEDIDLIAAFAVASTVALSVLWTVRLVVGRGRRA